MWSDSLALFNIVVILILGLRYEITQTGSERFDDSIVKTLGELRDSETRYAVGKRVYFSRAGIYEFEEIPGIGDVASGKLMAHRSEIMVGAAEYSLAEQYKALMIVDGIGEKTAKKIAKYVDLNR